MLTEPFSGTMRVLRFAHSVVIVADLGAIGVRLTPHGETELFGHVAYYLASWHTRATAGEAARPWSWAALRYDWDGRRLELPVLPGDADRVAAVLGDILSRPEATEPEPRRRSPRRTRR